MIISSFNNKVGNIPMSLFLAIVSIFGIIFLGLLVWSIYSSRRRNSLRNGNFTKMEILSETREEFGDKSKIPELARRFRHMASLRESFEHIAGDMFDSSSSPSCFPSTRREGSIRDLKDDVAFQYTKDGKKWAMYARRQKKPTNLSLRELVSEKTAMMEIEEDIFKRMNWSQEINECIPIRNLPNEKNTKRKTATATTISPKIEGLYSFCYRDYVNHEELMGMMWKRGGIESFLLKPSRADVVSIDKDSSECLLTANSKLFWTVPIYIRWEGKLVEEAGGQEGGSVAIHWNTTSLMMGWDNFGKFFDKPAAAEKLRTDPWQIKIPKDDTTGDILCFEREGKGHLVFARDECLSKTKFKSQ